jgi:hypothetical protein
MVYQWANTRLTKEYLKHLRVEPDAWFSIERNGKVKETYVEVTAVLPTAEEMRLKLANYKALMSGTVLWFATSLSKVNWIRRKVAEHGMGDRVLVGLFEDRRNFLTDPIWWHMDSETPVGWVKIAQPRVSIEDMTPGGDTLIYDERT